MEEELEEEEAGKGAAGATCLALLVSILALSCVAAGVVANVRLGRVGPAPEVIDPEHEREAYKIEVRDKIRGVRTLLASGNARAEGGDPTGALSDLEEARGLLEDMPLIARGSASVGPSEEIRAYLASVPTTELAQEIALAEGRAHLAAGGEDGASRSRATLEEGLALDPTGERAASFRAELARVKASRGDADAAVTDLRGLLEAAPDDVAIRRALVDVLTDAGRDEEAEVELSRALQDAPQELELLVRRGLLRFRLERHREAVDDFDACLEAGADGDVLLWRARARIELKDYERALVDAAAAIELDPADAEGHFLRAVASLKARRFSEAAKAAELACARDAQHWPARLALAEALVWSCEEDRAERIYQALIDDGAPACYRAKARVELGRILLAQTGSSLSQVEAAARVRAEEGRAPQADEVDAGMERLAAARWGGAAEHVQAALALEPDWPPALLLAARLALLRGDAAGAGQHLERVPATVEEPERGLLVGERLLLSGQAEVAEAAFAAAATASPRWGAPHAWLARARAARGLDPGAAFARARALRPLEDGECGFFFAEGRRRAERSRAGAKGEGPKAHRAFARVLAWDPQHTQAMRAWAALCVAEGETDVAMGLLSRAFKADPTDPESALALGELQLALPVERDEETGRPRTLRDPLGAEASYARALELGVSGEQRAVALHGRGDARRELSMGERGPLSVAADDLQQALDAYSPGSPRALSCAELLVEALEALGASEALTAAQRRVASLRAEQTDMARQAFSRGRALRDQLRYEEAISRFDRAVELDPGLSEAYRDRATCRLKLGQFVLGLLDLSRALELNPRIAGQAFDEVCQVVHAVDVARVLAELDGRVLAEPGATHVVFLRGLVRAAQAETPSPDAEALRAGVADLGAALELNPSHVAALVYRGHLLGRLGAGAGEEAYDQALADFARAEVIDPDSPLAPYLEAVLWARRGKGAESAKREGMRARAIARLRDACARGFKDYQRARAEAAFDELRAGADFQELMGER